MTPLATMIVLAAALVHAMWNLMLSKSDDDQSQTAAVILIWRARPAPAGAGELSGGTGGVAVHRGLGRFELAYFALLSTAYSRAPAGTVYPLARGSAGVRADRQRDLPRRSVRPPRRHRHDHDHDRRRHRSGTVGPHRAGRVAAGTGGRRSASPVTPSSTASDSIMRHRPRTSRSSC